MRLRLLTIFATLALCGSLPLDAQARASAQGWDPARATGGWAFQEVDGSLVFFDPPTRSLRSWMKGNGLLSTLQVTLPEVRKAAAAPKPAPVASGRVASDYDAAGALLYGIPQHQRPRAAATKPTPQPAPEAACEAVPERWVIDSYSRTWMACDGRLVILNKDGQIENALAVPAAIEDMAVGREGILVLYRTLKPYLEKRDLRTGAVLWSYGDRAQVKDAATQPLLVPLNRMALGTDGTVYLAEGASLAFTVLDPARGPKEPGQTFFTCHDALPGRALLGSVGRGPMLSWAGKDVIFSVFTPSQIKSCGAPESKGLVLARFDLLNGALEWIPTELPEGHRLVGLLDHEAVFLAPGGGLAYAPIR
ncbi:MAG TPA: hypothetical protein VJ528_10790 [Geothrix sp.]|uniref:hypothetical protein n=1 Tax=Geothrix mesophila TaxID=2922723 RepID=UPI001FAE07C6|nr:hypothetical protein [Geothrix sp. SG198]HJV39316.1 hypothetical protein [Geothrix sp.]